jgi:AraC family transcriptional regulator, transcriptional activator of pobA
VLLGGRQRGFSIHTAMALPARTLFAIGTGQQSFGLVAELPHGPDWPIPDDPALLRIRDTRAQAELTTLLETMQREHNEARPLMDEAMNAQARLLTVWLRREMLKADAEPARLSASEKLADAYAALVERDHAKGFAIRDFARSLGVTPTHLTRICKTTAGMTASGLLSRRLLHAARDLLENGDMPANRVAATLGFRSAAYFSRFIQQHTGHSPSALRKAGRAGHGA